MWASMWKRLTKIGFDFLWYPETIESLKWFIFDLTADVTIPRLYQSDNRCQVSYYRLTTVCKTCLGKYHRMGWKITIY